MFFTKISYLFLALRAGSAAAAQDILWLAYADVMAMLFIAMLSKQVGRALHALCCVPLCEGLKAIVCVPCAVHVCLRAAQVCQHAPNSRDLPQLASRLHTFTDQCGRGVDEQSNEQSNKQSNKQTLSKTEAQCSLFRSEAPLLFHALLTRHDMFVCCSMALDDTPWRRSVRECMQRGCVDGCQDPAAQNTHICESVSQLRCTTQTCTCCPPRDLPALQAWALQAFGAGHTYMHTHTHTHTHTLSSHTHAYLHAHVQLQLPAPLPQLASRIATLVPLLLALGKPPAQALLFAMLLGGLVISAITGWPRPSAQHLHPAKHYLRPPPHTAAAGLPAPGAWAPYAV